MAKIVKEIKTTRTASGRNFLSGPAVAHKESHPYPTQPSLPRKGSGIVRDSNTALAASGGSVASLPPESSMSTDNYVVLLQRKLDEQKTELDSRTDAINSVQRNFESLSEMYSAERSQFSEAAAKISTLRSELEGLRGEVRMNLIQKSDFDKTLSEYASYKTATEAELGKRGELISDLQREKDAVERSLGLAKTRSHEMQQESLSTKQVFTELIDNVYKMENDSKSFLDMMRLGVDGANERINKATPPATKACKQLLADVRTKIPSFKRDTNDPKELESSLLVSSRIRALQENISKAATALQGINGLWHEEAASFTSLQGELQKKINAMETQATLQASKHHELQRAAEGKALQLESTIGDLRRDKRRLEDKFSKSTEDMKGKWDEYEEHAQHSKERERTLSNEWALKEADLQGKLDACEAELKTWKHQNLELSNSMAQTLRDTESSTQSSKAHFEKSLALMARNHEAALADVRKGFEEERSRWVDTTETQARRFASELDALKVDSDRRQKDALDSLRSRFVEEQEKERIRQQQSEDEKHTLRDAHLQQNVEQAKAQQELGETVLSLTKLLRESRDELEQEKLKGTKAAEEATTLTHTVMQLKEESARHAENCALLNNQITTLNGIVKEKNAATEAVQMELENATEEIQHLKRQRREEEQQTARSLSEKEDVCQTLQEELRKLGVELRLAAESQEKMEEYRKAAETSKRGMQEAIAEMEEVKTKEKSITATLEQLHTAQSQTSLAIRKLMASEESCESAYTCLSCLEVLKNPTLCSPCGHTFCRKCLDKSSKRNNHGDGFCPECDDYTIAHTTPLKTFDLLVGRYTYRRQVLTDLQSTLGSVSRSQSITAL